MFTATTRKCEKFVIFMKNKKAGNMRSSGLTYWLRKSILRSLVHKSTASCFKNTLRLSCFGNVTSKSMDPLACKDKVRNVNF